MKEETIQKPVENKNKSTGIIIFFIFLVIIAFVGGLVFSKYKIQKSDITPTPKLASSLSPTSEISSALIPTSTPTVEPPTATLTTATTSSPTDTPTPTPTSTPTPTPTTAPKADLYISEYSFSKDPPKQGEEFTVRIGIYNKGNLKSGPFWWEWWPASANYACRLRINDGINASGGRIVLCIYKYGGWSNAYATKAVVDADNEVSESNEGNNTYTHTQNVVQD